jgi:hypothetical protein
VTVVEPSGKVDPEEAVQLPGVAPGIAKGVGHVTTAPAWLDCDTLRLLGTNGVPLKLAPVKTAFDKFALPKGSSRPAPERFAPVRMAPERSVAPHVPGTIHEANVAPERFASVRLAPVSGELKQAGGRGVTVQNSKIEFAKFANERLTPERLSVAKVVFGQLVKLVGVGFETMVQPLTTVSAEAGFEVAVAKTGVIKATAITRAEPLTRRKRRTIDPPANLDAGITVRQSYELCLERKKGGLPTKGSSRAAHN